MTDSTDPRPDPGADPGGGDRRDPELGAAASRPERTAGSPPLTSRQFWIQSPGRGEIVEREIPGQRPGHLRVRTAWTGISRGTESLVFRGEVPDSLHDSMRAPFQEGEFPAPVKYGYCSVGRIEGDSARAGEWVFCLYPHQDLYWVPPAAATPIPEGVPPARAVLAANLETALNGVWDGRPGPGDRIAVVGAGVVGLLTAWICGRILGARVTAIDRNPGREPVARALGVEFALPEELPRAESDLVFHASGSSGGAAEALALAGVEATVVELSWFGSRGVTLPLGEGFHPRRLTLRSSQVGRIPPDRVARWDFERRRRVALELLASDELDVLISGESPFAELPEVLARLSGEGADALCHRVVYPGTGAGSDPAPGPASSSSASSQPR